MFRRQVSCLFVIAPLSAHGNGRLKIKLQLTGSLDERIELAGIFEFCVAVEEQGCMVDCGTTVIVKLLQILDEVMDTLGVQILRPVSIPKVKNAILTDLANDLRGFCVINSPKVLLHRCIIVAPLVQEVTILAIDSILLEGIDADFLCKVDGKDVKIALI